MKQYHDLLEKILKYGTKKEDRTGTGTISLFGPQMEFDLSEGFPLVTTKKMFTRGMMEELLWFIRGSIDVKELQNKNVRFWDSWQREDGTIGLGYGTQMRNIEFFKEVIPRKFKKPDKLKKIKLDNKYEINYLSDTGKTNIKVGSIVKTKTSGDFLILEEIKDETNNRRTYWKGVFTATNNIINVNYNNILHKKIKDTYNRSFCGVGYIGNIHLDSPNYNMLINVWRDMIKRCYDKNSHAYKSYGAKGIFVSERWHSFENFYNDAQKLPGWPLKLEYPKEYSIDKDTLAGSNCYHKEVCKWASKEEQDGNMSKSTYFTAINPENNKRYSFYSMGSMSKKYNLNISAIHRCLNGKLKTHKGWKDFKILKPKKNGTILRYRSIDQLKEVIASIKHTPDSRRHIISLWNSHDIDYMELPCCHGNMIQFYVENGKLSLKTYQRSGDMFLGIPVNIASYSLFLMMIAQVCGLEPSKYIHSIGDAHIYSNHLEQVKEQLSRDTNKYTLPTMKLDKSIKNIDDFTMESFTLEGYESYPVIKAPVAV